jgi:hypothetical protein
MPTTTDMEMSHILNKEIYIINISK